jgi:Protein of unknown function (DUF1566)
MDERSSICILKVRFCVLSIVLKGAINMIKIALLITGLMLPSFVFAAVDCDTRPDHPKCQPDAGGGPKVKAVPLAQTGQTTSYEPGDDGDLQIGIPSPSPRFTDNGDGTLTDNLTGLRWTQDASQYFIYWSDAISHCNSYTVGELDDWRMPNFKELLSLTDYEQSFPALPSDHLFTNIMAGISDEYWSSTTNPVFDSFNDAMNVILASGDVRISNKRGGGYTLCLRGGW